MAELKDGKNGLQLPGKVDVDIQDSSSLYLSRQYLDAAFQVAVPGTYKTVKTKEVKKTRPGIKIADTNRGNVLISATSIMMFNAALQRDVELNKAFTELYQHEVAERDQYKDIAAPVIKSDDNGGE